MADDDDTLALGGAGADAPDSFITTLLPLLALLILVLALLLPLTLEILCVTLPMLLLLLLLLLFGLRPLLDARLSRDSGTGGLCATTGTVIGDDDVEEEFE